MTAAGGRDMLRGAKASGGSAEKQAGRGGRVALVSFQAAEARGSSPPLFERKHRGTTVYACGSRQAEARTTYVNNKVETCVEQNAALWKQGAAESFLSPPKIMFVDCALLDPTAGWR